MPSTAGAGDNGHETVHMVPVPKATETKSFTHSLFLFFEHPLFWGPIGIVGGLVGLFFYTPILILCGLCVLLAFHRAGVVSGTRLRTQIAAFLVVAVITGSSLYALRLVIQKHAPDIGQDIADRVMDTLRKEHMVPSETSKSPSQQKAVDEKSHDTESAAGTKPHAIKPSPAQIFQAPYGNLAKRCKDMQSDIASFVEAREKKKPEYIPPEGEEYWRWYKFNDQEYWFSYYRPIKALQKDLADSKLTDWRLDELIKETERLFQERQITSPQTVFDHPAVYFLRLEDIREIGERFGVLATQVPK